MKAREMSAALQAFAELAEANRGDGLRRLSSVFNGGKEEAVAARVKRVLTHWKANNVEQGHPALLRGSLAALASGLSSAGAKAQARDMEAVLSLFNGPASASLMAFIDRIAIALTAPPASKKAGQPADQALATQLADELARAVLDPEAFSKIAKRLSDSKRVSTPTLGAIANLFLGNSKVYSSRKPAIDDITKRQKQDARSHARGKALDRIGV